ncbi:DNA polymerase III subunits gamma and tau [Gallibacterium salpingitidis]|uniref:DNA polymerase III subunit gamma/tau n=1 Tax=Gallibacterium salpingitidis TaxID=505341 RepID=A0AB36E563_9PAST|nr:DNA polymerase III subunit gamma/tau [Gallibacterium salpingitidis]OBX08605.1 DNA polymerase III subunits gamma and tau [Gallibacterium salpingitidis]OBX08973.1 DNA polymerase III subunits gamma and tau [Gallibacterium salpingitidis]WKS98826.1 DNA polymerase III subunit gamma/tau [Gallibacterium salpingitidis]
MSYQVLARKWRPNQFSEVVGQDHVITALSNGLTNQRLHHAYLFSGTRGVGKTSIARLFAKGLNCEKGITAQPCGECENCRAIKEGNFIDLIEIDAASRTKVEDTRELLDNVQYKPVRGRFKIYLIDEVHMLSRHSFNALLKTLEEPPEYVKFLLATTDPQKLPITVLSRCIQFHLKALDTDVIADHLGKLLAQEKISYQIPALNKLAQAAQGSVRDALSLTDQAIALSNGNITTAAVNAMLGLLDSDKSISLLTAIAQADGEAAMQVLNDIAQQGVDWERVLQDMAETLHQIAMLQLLPPKNQQSDSSLALLAKTISAEDVQFYYQLMINGRKELEFSPEAKTGVEMTVLRALAFHPKRFSLSAIANTATIATDTTIQAPQASQQAVTAPTPVSHTAPAEKTVTTATPAAVATTRTVVTNTEVTNAEVTNQSENSGTRSSALLSSDILQQVANLEQGQAQHLVVTDHSSEQSREKKKDLSKIVEAVTTSPAAAINTTTNPVNKTITAPAEPVITPTSETQTIPSTTTANITPEFVEDTEQSEPDNALQDVTIDNVEAPSAANLEESEDGEFLDENYHWSWSDPSLESQNQVMRPSDIKKALLEKYTPEVVDKVVQLAAERSQWSADIERLTLAGGSKRILLNSVILEQNEHYMRLGVRPESFLLAKYLDLTFINQAFHDFYGRKIKIELEEYTGPEITPYEIRGEIYQQLVEQAQQNLQQDEKLNAFIQQFSAKIDLDSVRPTGEA